jgi:hypothetical protein
MAHVQRRWKHIFGALWIDSGMNMYAVDGVEPNLDLGV